MSHLLRRLLPVLTTGILLAANVPGQAQTFYWDVNGNAAGSGANPSGTWSTGGGNWNNNSGGTGNSFTPWNGGNAVFSAGTNGTGSYTVTVSGTVDISGLSAEEGSPTFNGGTIRFDGTPNFSVATGLVATINSTLAQLTYAGFNKTGAGELVLGGSNTFGAPVTVSAGTLTLANSAALGTAGTWGNTIASGATLALKGNINVNEAFSVDGTGVGGNGAIRNVSGSNTISNTLTVQSDTRFVSVAGTLTHTGSLALNAGLTTSGAGNITLAGGGYGSGSITHQGTGTLTFSGTTGTSFSGNLNIDEGTVVFAKSNDVQSVASGTINIGNASASPATLRLDANNQISDNTNIVIRPDGNFNVNGKTEGVKTLTVTGVAGQVNIGGGNLTVGTSGGGNSAIGGTVNVGGGALTFAAGTNTLTGTVNLGGGDLNFTNGTNTLSGTINTGGAGALLNFSGGNNSLGGTISGAFDLSVGGGSLLLLSSIIANDVALSGGSIFLGGKNLTADTLHVTGNSIIDFGGGNSTINLANLVLDSGVILTIQNWANAADYFYTQGWTGATFDTSGSSPMNQVIFAGSSGSNTHWQSFDKQVTPVPEPSTYGAFMLLGVAGFAAWRRKRRR